MSKHDRPVYGIDLPLSFIQAYSRCVALAKWQRERHAHPFSFPDDFKWPALMLSLCLDYRRPFIERMKCDA